MSRREGQQPRKKRRDESTDSSEDEEDATRLPYFVPEEGIDIEPLAGYVRGLLDRKARVSIGSHPSRRDLKGFWVESVVAIGVEDIRAMIEDTRSWRREKAEGYYVNSATMKRRRQLGRPQAAKERPIAPMKTQKDSEDPRSARQASRASLEPESRYAAPPNITRTSADSVTLATRQTPARVPSPRPASTQPIQTDPRRPSNVGQNPHPGYAQATAQYNLPQAQYAPSYESNVYNTAPPPYPGESKRGSGGGSQPSTTGTQGFQNLYATAGGPPRAANQGQRRHESR